MDQRKSALEEKLETLKEEYSKTKYNKATDKHLGILRRKIAEVKKGIIEASKGKHGKGFFVKRNGDATVALVGFPSTGKSTIINELAGTNSKTAPHAFTTLEIIPGMLVYKGAHIQIFDMPGIIEGANLGIGGGRSVISALRNVDLVVFVVDVFGYEKIGVLLKELKMLDININKGIPKVKIEKVESNIGIVVEKNASSISSSDIKVVLRSFNIFNARVFIEDDLSIDELIGLITGRSCYLKAIAVLNKIDMQKNYKEIADKISNEYGIETVPISAINKANIEELKEAIYKGIGIMTVYLRPKNGVNEPIILHKGSTVADAALKVHTELKNQLKCAYVSGPSAKFANQKVGASHVLYDGDIVTFIK
ncbi:MAG: GTPase [Candidatus Micrarchaeia archaeon]